MPEYPREAELLPYYDAHPHYCSPVSGRELGFIVQATGVDLRRVRTFLDLGSGDGRLSIVLAKRGIRCTAVDFSKVRVEKARRAAAGLPIEFRADNLHVFLNRDRRRYDLIGLFEVLEHLQAPRRVLSQARRLGPVIGSLPLDHPDVAHLQVFRTPADVKRQLAPDRIVQWGPRHVLCRWQQRSVADSAVP